MFSQLSSSCWSAAKCSRIEAHLVLLLGGFSSCFAPTRKWAAVKIMDELGHPGKEVHLGASHRIKITNQVGLEF